MGYFDDYYNDYEESAIDEAYEDFLFKVQNLVKGDLSEFKKQLNKEKLYYEERNQKLNKRERELNERERLLNKTQKEFQDKRENIIYEWLCNHGLDLKVGQKVFIIHRIDNRKSCPKCNKGRIQVSIDGQEYSTDCPICHGYGTIENNYYEIKEQAIKSIKTTFYIEEEYKKNRIIIKDTALGFMSYNHLQIHLDNANSYDRDEIYLTREEAEKALEEKQKKN